MLPLYLVCHVRDLGSFTKKLDNFPLIRAFLWGVLAAAALPPVHLLPVLLLSVPGFLRLIGTAQSWRRVVLIGWCYGFGLGLAGLYWITEPILTEVQDFWWLVPFAAPLLAAAVAFYMIIPALAAWLVPAGIGRILIFAGAWIASNLLQQFLFTGFPWNYWGTDWVIPGMLGNIFIQPAAYIGVYGLTLLTVLLACMPLFGKRGLVILACGLMLWAGYGYARLQTPEHMSGIRIGMVQPDFSEPPDYTRPALIAAWQRLLNMSHAALENGADALIWPEGSSPWLLASDPVARAQLAEVTGTTPVIAGSVRMVSNTDFRNSVIVTDGPQPPLAFYDKWKLVPFGEYMPKWIPVKIIPSAMGAGFTPGPGPKTISNIPGLPAFAPVICYEAIFSGEIIDRHARPAWIVDVTDDAWFGDSAGPQQDFTNTRLRAVEEGLPVARDANSGISAMIDPFGRVIASLPMDYQGVLIAPLPLPQPATFYARWGLWIPVWLAIFCIFMGLAFTILSTTRRNDPLN